MMLMKELAKPDSGLGEGVATRRMAHDSALATARGDETGEMSRGTLAARRSVPSNQFDVCFVTGCCNEETGRNLQVVMGKG